MIGPFDRSMKSSRCGTTMYYCTLPYRQTLTFLSSVLYNTYLDPSDDNGAFFFSCHQDPIPIQLIWESMHSCEKKLQKQSLQYA